MQTIRTIRCLLEIKSVDQAVTDRLFPLYAEACSCIAQWGRDHQEANPIRLHHALYRDIRKDFGLPANLVVTALRRAAGNLRASGFKGRFQYKPTFVALDARTFTLRLDLGEISFSTHSGKRVQAKLIIGPYQHEALWTAERVQSAILVRTKTGYYANIVVESQAQEASPGSTLGVDLGIRNIAATSSGWIRPGQDLRLYREDRWRIRASLQSKGTKGAKRALRRSSGRERRYAAWINHNVAKRIVAEARTSGASRIALEDLRGIRERTRVPNRHRNRMMALWAFRQLQEFIRYKATAKGIEVVFVPAAYTSKTCNRCLKPGIQNRETFVCTACGLSMDADLNGALVIAARGAAVNRPESAGQAQTVAS